MDFNTDSGIRGKFTRMAFYVNLDEPLVFQVLINENIQRVEFESLLVVCFCCRRYGHVRVVCPKISTILNHSKVGDPTMSLKMALVHISTAFLNPNFIGPVRVKVLLEERVLNPGRHSTIFFKENLASIGEKALKGKSSVKTGNGIYVGKGRGNGGKVESNKNGKILNKTIRGHKDRFKAIGNSRTPLSDTINFMAKFISSQIDVVDDTGTLPRNGKGLGSSPFAKQ
ncbi:hypothetical protein Gohar_018983 [Gossypium harknessii]|uniref:Zinc knuckle CX2CX4HX4C domain-containing protein n=1 Tax=Gossypium harknessii TaxID=34285 RepID=A0A7J9GCV6_9ROSI|nr:hypothetical protein [Gossypium harknessii]